MTNIGAEMDAAVIRLQDNHNRAAAAVADTWFMPFVGGREPAEGTLYVSQRTINFLKGEWKLDVLAGRRTFAFWQEMANGNNELLRRLVGTLPSLSFSGVTGAAVKEATADAFTVAKFGASGLLVAALLAILALFFWQRAVHA